MGQLASNNQLNTSPNQLNTLSNQLNLTAGAALVTTSRNKQARQSNDNTAGKSDEINCTYCNKHGNTFKGHRWQECRKLRRDQQRRKNQADNKQQQNPAKSDGLIAQAYISNELTNADPTSSWKYRRGSCWKQGYEGRYRGRSPE